MKAERIPDDHVTQENASELLTNAFDRPHVEFCVSEFRQTQEYHVINVHDGGLFPLVTSLPEGWGGMRAARGVNAVSVDRESCFKGNQPAVRSPNMISS